MKVILGIIRSVLYDFDKSKNEYVINKRRSVYIDFRTTTSFSNLPRLREVIEKEIREDNCTSELISEDCYDIDNNEINLGDLVLAYKSKYVYRFEDSSKMMTVNEVYYTSMELPDVADTYKI